MDSKSTLQNDGLSKLYVKYRTFIKSCRWSFFADDNFQCPVTSTKRQQQQRNFAMTKISQLLWSFCARYRPLKIDVCKKSRDRVVSNYIYILGDWGDHLLSLEFFADVNFQRQIAGTKRPQQQQNFCHGSGTVCRTHDKNFVAIVVFLCLWLDIVN